MKSDWKKKYKELKELSDIDQSLLDDIWDLVGRHPEQGHGILEDVEEVVKERDRLRAALTRAETLLDMAVTTISMREKKGG